MLVYPVSNTSSIYNLLFGYNEPRLDEQTYLKVLAIIDWFQWHFNQSRYFLLRM